MRYIDKSEERFFAWLKDKPSGFAIFAIDMRNRVRIQRTAKRIGKWMDSEKGRVELIEAMKKSFNNPVSYPVINMGAVKIENK